MGRKGRPGVGGQADLVEFSLLQALGLCSAVLKPNLDLRLRELQLIGELGTFGNAEILLLFELVFQRHQLLRGERGSGFAVSFVLSQMTS